MSELIAKKVGIAGAGAIAFGNAAYLAQAGHHPILWSPSGRRTEAIAAGGKLQATGAIEGDFAVEVADTAEDLVQRAEVLLIALPAYGHRFVLDAIAPHLRKDQIVVISSHASFGALYLSRLLAERGLEIPIVAWGTTVTTGRQPDFATAQVNTVRARLDMCTIPERARSEGLSVCRSLFGDRFVERDGLLAISLSNLNPQNHMGIALGNMTRMEQGEVWGQGLNVTPNIGRLLEALDAERLAIADALDLSVRTIFEHFHLSFHVPVSSISEMNQEMHRMGNGGTGPATSDSRYVTEDVPYGLVVTAKLGRLVGKPALLHEAGIEIFSAMYGRDFWAENTLLDAVQLEDMSLEVLKMRAYEGFSPIEDARGGSALGPGQASGSQPPGPELST